MNPAFAHLFKKVEQNRDRAVRGIYNVLPLPFENARKRLPGFGRKTYVIITANQKVGKTKFADYLFVYKSINYIMEGKTIKPHILYFTLEDSAEDKMANFVEYLYYKIDNMLVDGKVLMSDDNDNPCPKWLIDKGQTEVYDKYYDKFMETVEFNVDQATGFSYSSVDKIYEICISYAKEHGHYNYIKKRVYDPTYKCYLEEEVIDPTNPFTWDDENEMPIIIIDNFANLEVPRGSTIYQEIENMSKKCITLKNLGFIVVGVQHQAQEKESLTRRQANDVVPSAEGLDKNKSTAKDLTLLCGLMSPFKYEMRDFMGYDITRWKDNIRFFFVKEDRKYGAVNLKVPLLFIGESSIFEELPPYTDKEKLESVLNDLAEKKAEYDRNFYNNKSEKLLTLLTNKKKNIFARLKNTIKHWLQR